MGKTKEERIKEIYSILVNAPRWGNDREYYHFFSPVSYGEFRTINKSTSEEKTEPYRIIIDDDRNEFIEISGERFSILEVKYSIFHFSSARTIHFMHPQ